MTMWWRELSGLQVRLQFSTAACARLGPMGQDQASVQGLRLPLMLQPISSISQSVLTNQPEENYVSTYESSDSATVKRARNMRVGKGQVQFKDLGCHCSRFNVLIVSRCCCRKFDVFSLCSLSCWVVCYVIRFSSHIMMQHSGLSWKGEALQVRHSLCVEPASGQMPDCAVRYLQWRTRSPWASSWKYMNKLISYYDAGWQLARSGWWACVFRLREACFASSPPHSFSLVTYHHYYPVHQFLPICMQNALAFPTQPPTEIWGRFPRRKSSSRCVLVSFWWMSRFYKKSWMPFKLIRPQSLPWCSADSGTWPCCAINSQGYKHRLTP
jgi:hypothetical protein